MDPRTDWEGNARAASYAEDVSEQETVVTDIAAEGEEHGGFNVLLRLASGDRIEAGSFAAESEAHGFAQDLMTAASTGGDNWPRIGDRYLRPETIISIDVEPDAHPRWTGSTGRATSWTGRSSQVAD